MIIWNGYGILVPVIVFSISLLFQFMLDSLFYKGFYSSQKWPPFLALSLSSVVIWLLGRRLNKNNERVLVDPKTGEQVKLVKNHSFFWIKMEYWAIIFLLLGLWIAIGGKD